MIPKNLGNLLQSTRQSKNFDLKHIAEILKIKEKYLRAMEAGELLDIADKVYVCGYIKSYANWLGLNGDELAAHVKQSQPAPVPERILPVSNFKWYLNLFALSNSKIYIACIIVVAVAYSVLFNIRSSAPVMPLYHPLVKQAFIAEKLTPYEGKGLLFVAEKDVLITLSNDLGVISSVRYLPKGEVLFVTYQKSLRVTADYPEYIDIFLDDAQETFLGKMHEFFGL